LAASWKPLRKSKLSATTIIRIANGMAEFILNGDSGQATRTSEMVACHSPLVTCQ
jgi:hypothetical protein